MRLLSIILAFSFATTSYAEVVQFHKNDAHTTASVSNPLPVFVTAGSDDVKFGYVKEIDAADNPVDIWAIATDTIVNRLDTKTFLTSAATLYASSDNAADTDVDVSYKYLDSDGVQQTASVNLNGTTAVNLGHTTLDCSRAWVSGATAPVGNIYFSTDADYTAGVPDDLTTTQAYIQAGFNQTEQCSFMVPANCTARIDRFICSITRASGAAGSADVYLIVKPAGATSIVKRVYFASDSLATDEVDKLTCGPLSIVTARLNDVSDLDTRISAKIHYTLITNP